MQILRGHYIFSKQCWKDVSATGENMSSIKLVETIVVICLTLLPASQMAKGSFSHRARIGQKNN